ncbi:zinc finger protein 286A-like [Haliotis rubra]|uniref:zinc finger protein 286A-like n=1 Tax=Haliotis rubra TaxID=36100 RepID=UPI001EE60AEB|nr:zinc finger protein 286A-like [Haliotis rubra]
MEEETQPGLAPQSEENVDVGDPDAVSVATSIGSDFNSSQSQWALVPQNTLITFHTLPFNLEQIDGATDIESIEQSSHITAIEDVAPKLEESLVAQNVIDAQIDGQGHFPGNTVVDDVVGVPAATFSAVVEEALVKGSVETSVQVQLQAGTSDTRTEQTSLNREEFTPEIFCQVSATLSAALLHAIPGSHSVLLDEVQADVRTHLNIDREKDYTIIGNVSMLVRVYNKLQAMMPFCSKTRLEFVDDNKEDSSAASDVKVEQNSKGTICNLLVPLVSSHGREVHQPLRYSGCVQLGDMDQEDEEYKPRRTKRNRKMLHPRRVPKPQVDKVKVTSSEVGAGATTANDADELRIQERAKSRRKYELRTPFKYFCKICSFKTKRESHLGKHMLLHEKNTRLYPCSQCNFIAIRYSVMRRHEITHSGQGHKCEQCPYKADNAKLVLKHKRLKHTPKKSAHLKCPECNYRTSQDSLMARHIQIHLTTGELEGLKLSYPCPDCDYLTYRKEHYLRHRANVHGNSRPYLCDLCGMAFKRPDTLAQHKLTHQDRKDRNFSFHCKQCEKGFRSQSHLAEHLTMHSTERPYLCDHCGASFKTQNVQKKHIQTIHVNPRSFGCDKCSKRFNTKYALRRHVRTHDTQGMREMQNLAVEQLTTVDADALQTVHTVTEQPTLVQDVISASMEEHYDQSTDGLRQAYSVMPNNETTTALLYLTSNLQLD